MKKCFIYMLIVVVLLGTIMLSFVACNDEPPLPQEESQKTEMISLYDFAKEGEFSFGVFQEGYIMGKGYRSVHGLRYNQDDEATVAAVPPENRIYEALLLQNDSDFDEVIDDLQQMQDIVINDYVVANGSIPLKGLVDSAVGVDMLALKNLFDEENYRIENQVERHNMAFRVRRVSRDSKSMVELQKAVDGGKIWRVEQKEGFTIVYEISYECGYWDEYGDEFTYGDLYAGVYIYKPDSKIITEITAVCELLWYADYAETEQEWLLRMTKANLIRWILKQMTPQQRYELCQGYFEIMEEVVDEWLADSRGIAYTYEYCT